MILPIFFKMSKNELSSVFFFWLSFQNDEPLKVDNFKVLGPEVEGPFFCPLFFAKGL